VTLDSFVKHTHNCKVTHITHTPTYTGWVKGEEGGEEEEEGGKRRREEGAG